MVSRVMPASGPVSRRSSPSSRLISVDLPELGRPTTATRIGAVGAARRRSRALVVAPRRAGGVLRQRRAHRVVEIGQALAVLGRDRDRIAEAELIGFERAGLAGPALALVGDHDHRLAGAAHEIGECAVDRRQARARIDQEQDRVGAGDRRLGLRHACGR